MNLRLSCSTVAVAIAVLSTTSVQAQVSADTASQDGGDLIVTAQKREQRLQDVPVSIAVQSGIALKQANITNTVDLALNTPGLTISQADGQAFVYIRGLGSNLVGIGTEGSTSVYLDGVYLARPASILQNFLDVERVEVARGPQGTLYGQNSVGGAINIISAKPKDEFGAAFSATLGDYNLHSFDAMLNTPLIANILDARFAVQTYNRSGYYKNSFDSHTGRAGKEDNWSGRASFLYKPSDSAEITLIGDYYKTDGDYTPYSVTECAYACDIYGIIVDSNPYKLKLNVPTYKRREGGGVLLNSTWDFGWAELATVSAFRKNNEGTREDGDGTELAEFELIFGQTQKQYSQEVRLASKPGSRLRWIVGAYYFHETADVQLDVNLGPRSILVGDGNTLTDRFVASNRTTVKAIFGQASYDITDALSVTGGIRYSEDEKKFNVVEYVGLNGAVPAAVGSTSGPRKWTSWTPNFIAEYRFSHDANAYAKISKGFKSGGSNSFALQSTFDPETIWSYEAGAKINWLDRALTTNVALFYYSLKNQQISKFVAPTSAIDNAGKSRGYGAELEIIARPTQYLDLSFAGTYLDAKYQRLDLDDPATPDLTILDLSGNVLSNAPKWTFNTSATYRIPLGNGGEVSLRGSANYRSRSYYDPFNDRAVSQGKFALLNARIGYNPPSDHWDVGVFVNNITDQRYSDPLRTQTTGGSVINIFGAPRTFGVQGSVHF